MILKGGYPFPILLSSIIFFVLFILGIRFRKSPGAVFFIVGMALLSFQGFASIFELLAVHLDDKLFWRNVQQIPLYYAPIMLLGIVMSVVGTTRKTTYWSIATLSFITLFYWILLFTDTQHHLIRGTVTLETYGQLERIKFDRTHLGYLFLMYNKLMGLWGLVLLLVNFRKVYGIQKTQLIMLIIAIISPFFYPELASLIGWKVNVAESMLPTGILMFYVLFMYKFMQVSPMVKEKVLEHMTEGILIVDKQHRIVDTNPAALDIIKHLCGVDSRKGAYLPHMLETQPTLRNFYEADGHGKTEVECDGRIYDVRLIPILVRTKRTGSLLIFTESTERKIYENELIHIATMDGLTKLYNRRHFMERLVMGITESRLSGKPISLLLLDLDNFKKINDEYGHVVGDRVLEQFGRLMKDVLDDIGVVGRIGGEEFAAMLPDATGRVAFEVAERLRLRVLQEPLHVTSTELARDIAYTISIGVAELDDPNMTQEDWYHQADSCLYMSKNNGRNRTTLAG